MTVATTAAETTMQPKVEPSCFDEHSSRATTVLVSHRVLSLEPFRRPSPLIVQPDLQGRRAEEHHGRAMASIEHASKRPARAILGGELAHRRFELSPTGRRGAARSRVGRQRPTGGSPFVGRIWAA
jgi:hypothetical protein